MSSTPRKRMGEWMYSSTHSFTSALGGGEWSASRPGRFAPKERALVTHWIGWVGSRTVLDAVVKRKIPSSRRESNPRTPIVQPIAQRYTDLAIPAPNFLFRLKALRHLVMTDGPSYFKEHMRYFHVMPSLKTHGAIPPLLQTPSRRGA
jgi:hypothetical protein